jgi:hypothetical protein
MVGETDDVERRDQMKQRYANILLRLAFRIFRRYHGQLPKELNGIIWAEMTRKPEPIGRFCSEGDGGLCSMCVRELEEDRANQETVRRWLKGESA